MDNPEKLATQGTQDTGQINGREYRRGNEKDNPEKLATQGTQDKDKQMLENTEEAIKNGQPRETVNIGYTRHRTNKCQRIPKGQSKIYNPEKLSTQDTQETGQINVREYRRDNQKWTTQRNWQYREDMMEICEDYYCKHLRQSKCYSDNAWYATSSSRTFPMMS